MLDFLRKRKRSWITTFFLAVIVVTFVLFYGGLSTTDRGSESVAEVNGEAISQREFQVHYQRMIEFYRGLFKGRLTQEEIKNLNLGSAILEELVEKRLLLQEARRLGISVTDEELMGAIARVPDFQVNGRFSKNRYLQVLSLNRLTPAQFENEQREQLTIQKLSGIIRDSVHVTEAEARDRYRLESEKINLYFIRLSASDYTGEVKVTEKEIRDYYERNKETLKEPLRVQVEYLVYPFDRFASSVQINETEIEEYYKLHRDARFHQPRAVRIRHILFRVPAGADLKEKEKIRAKAAGVLRDARAGKDFGGLAKEFSEDASAARGGDVGWFSQGQMLPPLDKTALALKKGEISDVIESPVGYHIIKVEEVKEEKTRSLEEARAEILRELKTQRAKNEVGRAAEADREKALSGTAFSDLARARGVPFKVSSFITRFEALPEVGAVEEFNRVAFALGAKEVSPPVEGPNEYYLVRVKDRREPSIPAFEKVRADIERGLKETKGLEIADKKAGALLGQLKKEKDIHKLAKGQGLKVEETGWFLRRVTEIPKIGALRELRPGGIPVSSYQPIPDKIYTADGNLYLFAFKESQAADMERFEKEKANLQEQMLAEKRQRTLQKFVESLKAKARIKVRTRALEES